MCCLLDINEPLTDVQQFHVYLSCINMRWALKSYFTSTKQLIAQTAKPTMQHSSSLFEGVGSNLTAARDCPCSYELFQKLLCVETKITLMLFLKCFYNIKNMMKL